MYIPDLICARPLASNGHVDNILKPLKCIETRQADVMYTHSYYVYCGANIDYLDFNNQLCLHTLTLKC